VFLVLHFRLLGHIGIGSPYSEGIIKSRDTTGISDREYREYRDITQEWIVYLDILKNVDRPMSSSHGAVVPLSKQNKSATL